MEKQVYKQGKQFVWEEDDKCIKILFLEMYFRYFYIFSSRASEYPKLVEKNVQIFLSKQQLTINFINFSVPIFEGKFTNKILLDESYWTIDTKNGIYFNLSKSQEGQIWNSPFSSYSKELLFQNLLFEHKQDSQAVLSEFPNIPKEFFQLRMQEAYQYVQFTIELTKKNFPRVMWEKQFDEQNGRQVNNINQNIIFSLNDNRETMFKDILKKNQVFQEQSVQQMKLGMIDCTYYAVMEKTFLLAKLIRNTVWNGNSVATLIEDPLQNVIKLYIYNLDQKYISKDTWLLIQEPFTKPGATDSIPMIRVDNPKDIIMQVDQQIIQQKQLFQINVSQYSNEIQQRISKIHQEEDYVFIYELNQQEYSFSCVIFEEKPNFVQRSQQLFIEQSKDNWIGANIVKQSVKTDNFIIIELEQNEQSITFLSQLSRHQQNTPGKCIILWRPAEICIQGFLEKLLISNSAYSTENFNNLISIWYLYYESDSKNAIEDACDLWIHNQNALTIRKNKKSKNNQTNEVQIKCQYENAANQIQDILDIYDKMKSEQTYASLDNVTFDPIKYQTDISISQQQLDLKDEVYIDKKEILTNLLNENDQSLLEIALFHLNNYLNAQKFIKNKDKFVSISDYSDIVLLKKLSPGEYNMNQTIKALELINFGYNQQIVDKIWMKKQKKKENKKNKKKLKQKLQILENLTNQPDLDIKVVTDDDQTNKEVEQFQDLQQDENMNQNQQNQFFEEDSDLEENLEIKEDPSLPNENIQEENIKDNLNDEQKDQEAQNLKQQIDEIDDMSETNSIKSLLTVHSRLQAQKANNHWKDRLKERSSIEISDQKVKESILKEIKEALKKGGSRIIQSRENPDRFLVKDFVKRVQFVLQKFKTKEKDVYIPITILNMSMKFK